MGIEESLRIDADALAREVNAIDEAAVLRRVFASLDASATVDVGASAPGRPEGRPGRAPAASRQQRRQPASPRIQMTMTMTA